MPNKPGYTTSEFWAATVTALIGFLNQAFGWNIPPETFASVAAIVAGYAISRGLAKKQPTTSVVAGASRALPLIAIAALSLSAGGLTSCQDTSAIAPTITNSAVGKVGTDLNEAAKQALADYAYIKGNGGVDYVWALGQMFNAYATIATTRADVEALVAQWDGTKDQSTANRIADLFGGSSGSTTTRMLALAQASLDTANNLTKGGTAKPAA